MLTIIQANVCLAVSLAGDTIIVTPYSRQAAIIDAKNAIGQRHPSPVEGVWQINDGAYLAIAHDSRTSYKITIYGSPDLSVKDGTIVGKLTPGARPRMYDARLAKKIAHSATSLYKSTFVVNVADDGSRLEFTPYKKGLKVDFRRLFPYMFRFSVQMTDTRPPGLLGARRIYPEPIPTSEYPLVF